MNPFVRVLQDSRSLAKHTDTHGHTCVYMLCLDVLYCTVAQKNVALSFSLSLSLSLCIYIYIYMYCHPQTDCFFVLQLFSVARHSRC